MAERTLDGLLLERETELAAIGRAVGDALAGQGRALVVVGSPGAGKTTLVDAAGARAASAGLQVLTATGSELERDFGFGIVRQLFERRVRASRSPQSVLSGHARLASPLLGFAVEGEATAQRPDGDVFATLNALYWLTAGLAAEGPLALLVDDAHWADSASLRFLQYLARRLEGLPVLLMVACRPPAPDDPLLDGLLGVPRAELLAPQPLSIDAGLALLRSLLPDVDPELLDACQDAAGGNVFYLTELGRALHDQRSGTVPVADLSPEAVTRSVARRVAALPSAAGELARAASVLGPRAPLRRAAALADLEAGESARAADALRTAAILAPGRALDFIHPIVRAAVLAELEPGALATAHARAAALVAADGEEHERVAAHLLAAEPGADPWAREHLRAAAERALARGAPDAAARYLRGALAVRGAASAERRSLLVALGTAEAAAFEPHSGIACLGEALELSADPDERREVAVVLANLLTQVGRAPEGTEVLGRELYDSSADPGVVAAAEAHLVDLARFQVASRRGAQAFADRLRARFRDGDDTTAVLATVAAEMVMAGEPAGDVAAVAGRVIERTGADSPALAAGGYGLHVALRSLMAADELELATRVLDREIARAGRNGAALDFMLYSTYRADAAYRRGAVGESETDARSATALALERGWTSGVPGCVAPLVTALTERGELEEAAAAVASAGLDAPAADLPDLYTIHLLLHARGALRVARGQLEPGIEDLLECGRRQDAHGETNPALIPWRSSAALALRLAGDAQRARDLAREELDRARMFGAPRALGIALRVAAALKGPERGLAMGEAAVETLSRSAATLEHARALADLGERYRRGGNRQLARDVLGRALEFAHRCGAVVLERQIFDALRVAGARPRRPLLSGPESLTPSERRVAKMTASGMSNREVAQALFVTVRTVEFHLLNTYRKLDISSRRDLRRALSET